MLTLQWLAAWVLLLAYWLCAKVISVPAPPWFWCSLVNSREPGSRRDISQCYWHYFFFCEFTVHLFSIVLAIIIKCFLSIFFALLIFFGIVFSFYSALLVYFNLLQLSFVYHSLNSIFFLCFRADLGIFCTIGIFVILRLMPVIYFSCALWCTCTVI